MILNPTTTVAAGANYWWKEVRTGVPQTPLVKSRVRLLGEVGSIIRYDGMDVPGSLTGDLKHSYTYPWATNILTGRGRNVQISASGKEVRSVGRDELIFQNEFIYRKISYHDDLLPHGVSSIRGSVGEVNVLDGYIENNPIKTYSSIDVEDNNDMELDEDLNKIIIRERNSVAEAIIGYKRNSVYDKSARTDLFNDTSLVCIPTFSLPDIFNISSTRLSYSHIFGLTNSFTGAVSATYPDSTMANCGIKWTDVSSTPDNLGLLNGYGNPSNGAFIRILKVMAPHIIDVNSSVVSLDAPASDTSKYCLTATILFSLSGKGVRTASSSDFDKSSFSWSNQNELNVSGGGLVCAVVKAELKADGSIVQGTWRSTFSTTGRDAGIPADSKLLSNKQITRSGIWMQPLIGLGRTGDNYNNPYYWPGSFPWSSSLSKIELGSAPGTLDYPQFYSNPPGMMKVPLNKSFISKMGKHSVIRYKKSGESSKWFAVIGPVVYYIDSAATLKAGPLSWTKSSNMNMFEMPKYEWDSRPVVFQRFGFTKSEMSNLDGSIGDDSYKDLFEPIKSKSEAKREISSGFVKLKFDADMSVMGDTLRGEFLDSSIVPEEGNSFAMLGEGVGFSVSSGSDVYSFVWWKDSFWRLTPGTDGRTEIVQIEIPSALKSRCQSAYSLHRLYGSFNGNNHFVVSGNSGNNSDTAFMYVFKFKLNGVTGTTGDLYSGAGFSLEYNFPLTGNDAFSVTPIDEKCNQSWRYPTWMSSDASILVVGNHQWSIQGSSTPSGNPESFLINIYSRVIEAAGVIKYKNVTTEQILLNNSFVVDQFCQSIWGKKENNHWDIHVCSGADPEKDFDFTSDATEMEKRFGRVHVFKYFPIGSVDPEVIELNDSLAPSNASFVDKSFSNLNFWTVIPMSSKNGMCGMMYTKSTGMVISTGGHLVRLEKTSVASSSLIIKKIKAQSLITNDVKRVDTPYSDFGLDTTSSNVYADKNSNLFTLSTISVPSCYLNAESCGFQRMSSKLAYIKINLTDSIISICNFHDNTIDQQGIFDINDEISSEALNPANFNMTGFKTGPKRRNIYNPSVRSWLCSFDHTSASFGDVKVLPVQGYTRNKSNKAHLLVRPPRPDTANKQFLFAGLDCSPVDANHLYRDYNDVNSEKVKGTLMQMDWHDVAGILWFNKTQFSKNIYILRSFHYDKQSIDSSDSQAISDFGNHINKRTYYVDNLGVHIPDQNSLVQFIMPSENGIILPPTEVKLIGVRGIGLTGAPVITVAACSCDYLDDGRPFDAWRQRSSYILPLLRPRSRNGCQKLGIIIDDRTIMNEVIINNIGDIFRCISPITNYVLNSTSFPGENGEEFMHSGELNLAYDIATKSYHSKTVYGQSGFSIPWLVAKDCDGYSFFVRKTKYSTSNTKWNYLIKDISSSLDPIHGSIHNNDLIWVARNSYIGGITDSSHVSSEYYYLPEYPGSNLTSKIRLLNCICKDEVYDMSRSISKWKTSLSADSSILKNITSLSGSGINTKYDAGSNGKLKDLVLIGQFSNADILSAGNSVTDIITKIKNTLYPQTNAAMLPAGILHIVDTDKEAVISDLKMSFIKEFQKEFNGSYYILRGSL